MIMNQADSIVIKIVDLLAGDKQIRSLLKDSNATAQDMIDEKLIVNYPVILNDNKVSNFISVHHDNTVVVDNNTYVTSFKISCGVTYERWMTEDKHIRSYLLSERIEKILNNLRIENSTNKLNLATINSIYWNELVTGQSLIFQLTEMGDINDKKTIV